MDLLQEVKDEERLMKPLTDRMDKDIALINVADRVLRDTTDNPKKIPNSVFVPLNDLAVFVTTVESYLYEAEEQCVVTSEDENLDTAEIETIIKAIWKSVDDRWSQGIGTGGKQLTFSPFTFQQTTRRGRTAHPCYFRIENGKLVSDLRAWDSRFATYRMDDDGYKWVAYHTIRSKSRLQVDYPDLKLPDSDQIEVRNIWTRKENIVYVDESIGLNEPHPCGYVPAVCQTVPLGSMLMDANSVQYEGESILLMVRDVFPELVRLASINQSLNMKELDHALQEGVEKEEMDGTPPPDHDKITDPRNVTKTTGGFTVVPIGELRQQARDLSQMLEARMQRGGISNFDLGTFNQTMSAVALIRVGQGRDKVYSPRLATHGLAKINLTKMAIKQILAEAERKKLRKINIDNQTYDLAILKEHYTIDFKYIIRDTTIEVAKQSLAVSQKNLIPRISILRDTLQRDDPDGDVRELYSEEAELLFPNIKRKRILKALAEKAEKGDEDAQQDLEIGLAELGMTIDQLFAGQLPPVQPVAAEKPPQPMVDLFDTTGGAVSNMTKGAT